MADPNIQSKNHYMMAKILKEGWGEDILVDPNKKLPIFDKEILASKMKDFPYYKFFNFIKNFYFKKPIYFLIRKFRKNYIFLFIKNELLTDKFSTKNNILLYKRSAHKILHTKIIFNITENNIDGKGLESEKDIEKPFSLVLNTLNITAHNTLIKQYFALQMARSRHELLQIFSYYENNFNKVVDKNLMLILKIFITMVFQSILILFLIN